MQLRPPHDSAEALKLGSRCGEVPQLRSSWRSLTHQHGENDNDLVENMFLLSGHDSSSTWQSSVVNFEQLLRLQLSFDSDHGTK